MKVFKKIGLGIISLGLISTFYIPEAKASITLVEFYDAEGTRYAIKQKSNFQYILKKVGSGNKQCKMYIYTEEMAEEFKTCVLLKVGDPSGYAAAEEAILKNNFF